MSLELLRAAGVGDAALVQSLLLAGEGSVEDIDSVSKRCTDYNIITKNRTTCYMYISVSVHFAVR